MIDKASEHALVLLGTLLLRDLRLGPREPLAAAELEAAGKTADALCERMRLVYTAFDGDQQQLCSHMRRYILRLGDVPANPPSILGYKETVEARLTKDLVLRDDLAILARCDELIVFTDLPCSSKAVDSLAEGAIAELLFFLKRQPGKPVSFVSPLDLAVGLPHEAKLYKFDYEETLGSLDSSLKDGLLDMLEPLFSETIALPCLLYHVYDPLDFKYAPWLRVQPYSEGLVPLVPGLAVELLDAPEGKESLGTVVGSWLKLVEICDQARFVESMDIDVGVSAIADLMLRRWASLSSGAPPDFKRWDYYSIPKARMGARWPLTEREALGAHRRMRRVASRRA